MVYTKSQKRRGMPKRATRKNLKNRNAQTKRRGQQKGGATIDQFNRGVTIDEFNHIEHNLKAFRKIGIDKIELEKNPNAIANLVFDVDFTLTAKHSGGRPMDEWTKDNKITVDAFGGKLKELKKILEDLKKAGYNLFVNSRGSRSQLIKFFKLKNIKLIDLIPEKNIFGANDEEVDKSLLEPVNESNSSNSAVSYDEIPISAARYIDKFLWAYQKLRYLKRILQDTGNIPTIFYDDTKLNIDAVNIPKNPNNPNNPNLKGIHIEPRGLSTTLEKLKDLLSRAPRVDLEGAQGTDSDTGVVSDNSGYNGSPEIPRRSPFNRRNTRRQARKNKTKKNTSSPSATLPPSAPPRKYNTSQQDDTHVVIKMDNKNTYKKPAFFAADILLMFDCKPRADCIVGIYYESSRGEGTKSMCKHLSRENCENTEQITYEMLQNKLEEILGKGNLKSNIKIDPNKLEVSYDTILDQDRQKTHLSELVEEALTRLQSQAGGSFLQKNNTSPQVIYKWDKWPNSINVNVMNKNSEDLVMNISSNDIMTYTSSKNNNKTRYIYIRGFGGTEQYNPKRIFYYIIKKDDTTNKWELHGIRGFIGTKSYEIHPIDFNRFKNLKKIDPNDSIIKEIRNDIVEHNLYEKPPQAGGRKSKSNPKTRTQKRRSTNPKNKRTRKSKK